MKKYLNTLYVTTQGAYLNKDGEALCVAIEHEVKLRVPIHMLDGVVCFGNVMCSPFLMHHCAENGVLISFLSEHGRFLARVSGPVSGNVLLRREQYRRSEDPAKHLEMARAIVLAKVANARTVLLRAQRDHGEKGGMEAVTASARRLDHLIDRVRADTDVEILRGREGEAARTYFEGFDGLITAQKEAFAFRGRSRRPPLDNINCLLSFVYTLLAHDCEAALETVGLDPQVGFLHRERPGRASLALDLMEEFRPSFADRLVLSLVNLRQVQAGGFVKRETGAVEMTEETRKTVLTAYQKRKQEEMTHPFLGETAPLGLFWHLQAQLLARHIRGDLDGYPPVIWK
ncbi:MAG: type I-C CRISPR-associated endonuclease Cas1c [Verrucomicrobia bacterium]|nr:type I-C CRISPR-associated endonuclease Cas1c [Verrucomicrobiota bacterium]